MLSKDGFFTPEQDEWLIANYSVLPNRQAIVRAFNAHFGTDRNVSSISDRATRKLHLRRDWNSGQYGPRIKEGLPIGSIRENQVATYIKVKHSYSAKTTGYSRPYWIPLQEKIWTDAYGPIPKDSMVCFLDHDRHNFSLDNLYPIDRKISARMSQNNWWSDNPTLTLTAIKWCELFYSLKSAPAGGGN